MEPQQKIEKLAQFIIPEDERLLSPPKQTKTELPTLASINISFPIRQNNKEKGDALPSILYEEQNDVRKRVKPDFVSENNNHEENNLLTKISLDGDKNKSASSAPQSIDSLGLISKTLKAKNKTLTSSVPASVLENERKEEEKKERRKQRERAKKEKPIIVKDDDSKNQPAEERPVQLINGIIAEESSEEENLQTQKKMSLGACTVDELKLIARRKKIAESDGIEYHVKFNETINKTIPLVRSSEEIKYVGALRDNGAKKNIAENWYQSLSEQKKTLTAEIEYKKPKCLPKQYIKVKTISKYSYLKKSFEQMIISKTEKDPTLKDKNEILPSEKLGDGYELSDSILLDGPMIIEMVRLLQITPVEEFIPDDPRASRDHRNEFREQRNPQPFYSSSLSPSTQRPLLVEVYSAYDPKNLFSTSSFIPQQQYIVGPNDYMNFNKNPYSSLTSYN
ncbi:hypothetical protein EHI8A_084170 [Entamoeba histolytica HM-1:IMSS-B]|nr:hypothetical protein EHI8A_084170 [Entamoeba histolytica HM-1:IMSS-B]EMS12833.1 meiotic recombination repair protein [Entamoeba histolytica HM-3:IMSS]